MNNGKFIRNKKGITLITLIITIIIMCVLVGVSIGIIVKNDYFRKAENTATKAEAQLNNQIAQEGEIKNSWEEKPGQIIRSETKRDTTITIQASVSNITRTSFRINVTGTNANGDILTFTLKLGDTTYEAKTGEEVYWDITGLEPGTAYKFEITATDNDTENNVIGRAETLANNRPTLTVDITTEQETATITANGTDKDGDTLNYTINIKNSSGTTIYTSGPSTTSTWELTELTASTKYEYEITVDDGFDTTTKTGEFTTKAEPQINTPPVINSYICRNIAKNRLQIRINATDAEQTSLIYSLYTSDSKTGEYTLRTQTTQNKDINVDLTATGFNKEKTYWYITVSDGTNVVQAFGYSCSGNDFRCDTTLCLNAQCENCGGTGNAYCNGDDDSWTFKIDYGFYDVCPKCNGDNMKYDRKMTCQTCRRDISLFGCV